MAEAKGNTAVPQNADVDRVQMLSLNADGTPNQTPGVELIGNREFAEAATKEQFKQQAVSAVDQRERGVAGDGGTVEDAPQDPTIAALQEKHEAAADAAVKAADKTVDDLFTDDPARTSTQAGSGQSSQEPVKDAKPTPGATRTNR
jgi:hypothetical protein